MNEKTRNLISFMARPMSLKGLIHLTAQHSIFPFYHTVSPEPLPHISQLYRVLKPEEFEKDLEQLLQYYEPRGLGDYLENTNVKTGRPSMVLTFDDGLKGCYDFIAPLLKKKGIPAAFFLNNRFIDNRGLFYRYKASLLIHRLQVDCRIKERLAGFLKISKEQVETSIRMIGYMQRSLLDAMAVEAELDFASYLRAKPVYMSEGEIQDLLDWGFDVGGHSSDHRDFTGLDKDQMEEQVRSSLMDLGKRFDIKTGYFSFPFTSDGVPKMLIDRLLENEAASALLGTAGLKQTGNRAYIQRIPMEKYQAGALETLRTEYFYYLLKMPLGRNRLRK
jgi:peptidoglycan/xylan/chitin deacetylase (PgdA/CDA1 family)